MSLKSWRYGRREILVLLVERQRRGEVRYWNSNRKAAVF
jgi:hypothetical protein